MPHEVHPAAAGSWSLLVERMKAESDDRRRRNLAIVAEHVVAEVAGDLDVLARTLVDEPTYVFWTGEAASRRLDGMAEVMAFYEDSISTGKNRLAFDISRVVVDDDSVVTEGVFTHAFLGSRLPGRTLADGSPLRPDTWYLVNYHALVVWPINGAGLIEGETIYLGQPHRVVRPLAAGEEPHLGLLDRA